MLKAIPKIKGGALQFVLFIAVVIALLLMSFVLMGHTHHFFSKKTDLLVSLVKSNDIGLQKALGLPLTVGDTVPMVLHEDSGIDHKVTRDFWGVYEKYCIVSKAATNTFSSVALVGNGISENIPALYLQDNDRPMILVGKAKITGTAFLPKQGVKAGNIAGHSYQGNSLVYGQQQRSGSQLPRLSESFNSYLIGLEQLNRIGANTLDFKSSMQLQNSFKAPTQYVVGGVVDLRNCIFTGNIIIRAEQRILVRSQSQLRDVILIAPEIEIDDRVVGTFQAFATKRIKVGKGCTLLYPSALVVNGTKPTKKDLEERLPNIMIEAGTHISGTVMYQGNFEDQKFMPQIKMAEKSTLFGQLYCTQNLELKGAVTGSVFTNAFVALENGSIYQNHLYQGTINSSFLPMQYAGLLWKRQPTKTIAKCLY